MTHSVETKKIVLAGTAGTSAMTLFSYAVSEYIDKNFKEPRVLGALLERVLFTGRKNTEPAGWLLHYGVGLAFTSAYDFIWRRTSIKPTVKNGLIMGGVSSLAGIAVWDLTFKTHPNPPAIHLKRYYGHLILAHLIFGAFTAIAYKNIKGRSGRRSPA
jgi:hypothetical protein